MSQRTAEIDVPYGALAVSRGRLNAELSRTRPVKVIAKASQGAIISTRKAAILKRIGDAQSEIGRLNRLLDELRTDVLNLTIE